MHETKKPPYLTQCLRGKGDEIESAFEKSADILFRYFHWVMAVEACTADRQIADHVLEFLDRHVAKRVGSDLLADLLRGVRACDQLFVRRNIGAEIARIQERKSLFHGQWSRRRARSVFLLQQIRERSA